MILQALHVLLLKRPKLRRQDVRNTAMRKLLFVCTLNQLSNYLNLSSVLCTKYICFLLDPAHVSDTTGAKKQHRYREHLKLDPDRLEWSRLRNRIRQRFFAYRGMIEELEDSKRRMEELLDMKMVFKH